MIILDTINKRLIELDENTAKSRIELGILYRYLDKSRELKSFIDSSLKATYSYLRRHNRVRGSYENVDKNFLASKTKIPIKKEIEMLERMITEIRDTYGLDVDSNNVETKIKELILSVKTKKTTLDTINFKVHKEGSITVVGSNYFIVPRFLEVPELEVITQKTVKIEQSKEEVMVIKHKRQRVTINLDEEEEMDIPGVNCFPVPAFQNLKRLLMNKMNQND